MAPEDWQAHAMLLQRWEEAYPNSTTAKTATALYWKEFAWLARGLEYADTVNENQWAIFNSRMQKSRQLLEALRARRDLDAAWYAGLLSIAKAQAWREDDFEKLYKEATRRFPDYLPLYFFKAAQLSPRWGGSQQAFSHYVDDVVAATSSQMGETMYARLNWSSSSSTMFSDGQADWPRMKRGFERLTHDYPDRWNINAYAKFACVAGDAGTLKQQLDRITQAPVLEAWGSMGYFSRCSAFARGGSR